MCRENYKIESVIETWDESGHFHNEDFKSVKSGLL
jgi:hypothetical protein